MYTAIKNYCENERKNGLYLIDMPTGFGKTYNVIKYIFDASTEEKNKDKRYFFITTLKKNLPKKELENRFNKAGKSDRFKEKFLFIDSNADCVRENLTDDLKKKIPAEITKTDEYKELEKNVRFLRGSDNDAKLKQFVSSIQDNLQHNAEPGFRKMLERMLAKEYSSVGKRIYAIKTDKKWQWLGELYPAVFTRDRQIIFMSVDKFLTRNATIVEPSYMFYNSDVIDNAIIFIDEFDATKDTVLKHIIQNGLRGKIDYVDLFDAIYSSLQTASFPANLTIPSQKHKEEHPEQNLQRVIERIRDMAGSIYEKFSLQFCHKTDEIQEGSHNFLFQDHQFHTILDGNNSYITSQKDTEQKINAIRLTREKPGNESNNIQVLLGKLRGFISYFQRGVYILATNYRQRKLETRKDGDDEFAFDSAVRSVLSLFRLDKNYIDYLTSQILIASRKSKGYRESAVFDLSFYERGFRFYDFEDDVIHDMQSRIMMCSFQNTPEKILLKFCERAKVIGISATATIETVVGNYDLEYLQKKMQSAYQKMSKDDYDRLCNDFKKTQAGYDDIKIHTELLGESDPLAYSAASWDAVFDDRELSQQVYDMLQTEQANDNNNYNKERYLRIALAYRRFICAPDIKSFLCVLTKHPKEGDFSLNLTALYKIFELIAKKHDPGFDSKKSVALIDGDEYESKKNDATERLERGEKLFVISVYQTIGTGQNLQYKAPDTVKNSLIKVNDRSNNDEKDYDAIYLDKPTYLLVPFWEGQIVEDDDFVKALFQYEFLQEWAELSQEETKKLIKKAFRHYMSNGGAWQPYNGTKPHDTKSVYMLLTRCVIQAIGRICRTSLKNKNIYIFADRGIADSLDLSVADKRMLNKEVEALLDCVRRSKGNKSPEMRSPENEAALISSRVNKDIRNMLEEEWDDKRIEKWRTLRELSLKSPTISKEDVGFIESNYYIQLPSPDNKYYYCQEGDFNNITVSFTADSQHRSVVSANGTRLPELMQFPEIKAFFEEQGYATTFEPGKYIMSPPMWNNIYKGAIGEAVGKFLFDRVLHIKLDNIEDVNQNLFELFDFKVADLPIYVDFKNWSESTDFDRDEQIEKIVGKAEKCGCECVIIANIITPNPNQYNIQSIMKDGIEIIVIPALLQSSDKRYCPDAWRKIKEIIDKYAD